MMRRWWFACLLAPLAMAVGAEQPSGKEAAAQAEARRALADLQRFVGGWKGVGQRQRGSTDGAWQEQADWVWDYSGPTAAIVFRVEGAKFYVSGRVTRGEKAGEYRLAAKRPDGEEDLFRAQTIEEDRVVFRAESPQAERPVEISLRLVAEGKRMMMLFQRKLGSGEQLARLAEVGYTRKGSRFGQGGMGPECVVTGGAAEIAVTYQGQTYYVCCTGCRDYFNDNPAQVLAEYRERLAERKRQAEAKPD